MCLRIKTDYVERQQARLEEVKRQDAEYIASIEARRKDDKLRRCNVVVEVKEISSECHGECRLLCCSLTIRQVDHSGSSPQSCVRDFFGKVVPRPLHSSLVRCDQALDGRACFPCAGEPRRMWLPLICENLCGRIMRIREPPNAIPVLNPPPRLFPRNCGLKQR